MKAFNIQAESEFLRERVDGYLHQFLAEDRVRHARHPIFSSLYKEAADFVLRPGKRLRPLLYLKARALFAPDEPADDPSNLAVAAALEILHAFILVHDDIIDRSELRRGELTLHRAIESRMGRIADRERTGGNLALVMGDLLFTLGQRCLLRSGSPHAAEMTSRALDYIFSTGVGEASDIIFGVRDISRISLEEIEEMYWLKTTRYTFEGPLVLAGISAGLGLAQLDALARIANPAGLAFQAENDLAEFERSIGDDAQLSADLVEGKKTMLAALAFSRLNESDRTVLQLCLNGVATSEGTVNKVQELIGHSGAVERLQEVIEMLFRETMRLIETAPLPASAQEGLKLFFEQIRMSVARRGVETVDRAAA